jgi:hypothetical protein
LFEAHVAGVVSLLTWQVEDGTVWDLDSFRRRLAPLETAFADTSLTLALTPSQIKLIADAFVVIDLNLRAAQTQIEFFDKRYAAAKDGNAKGDVLDSQTARLKMVFKTSYAAFAKVAHALTETR